MQSVIVLHYDVDLEKLTFLLRSTLFVCLRKRIYPLLLKVVWLRWASENLVILVDIHG